LHMSEKPVGMLKHFMGMMVDEYSNVLDPTAGSANSIKAARDLGAASVLGLEINTEFYDRAVAAYFDKEGD
jgi:DNA modification methylase